MIEGFLNNLNHLLNLNGSKTALKIFKHIKKSGNFFRIFHFNYEFKVLLSFKAS